MPTAYLTRTVQFSAAHRYFRPEWSEAKNAEVFGKCAAPHGHGHTYQCSVTVRGRVDETTGMSADLGLLDRLLAEEVVARLDHRHLNLDLPEYAYGRTVPTGEELCVDIWRRVAARLPAGCALASVRVQEEPALFAEYRGEA
ncbi:MAG TPA: 6-carboxytetrahydropterin synthase [Gemmatimonadales bacterium]|nr:6-carboxytetrahydropterin synthase [Gemmatimonadales bacterium]